MQNNYGEKLILSRIYSDLLAANGLGDPAAFTPSALPTDRQDILMAELSSRLGRIDTQAMSGADKLDTSQPLDSLLTYLGKNYNTLQAQIRRTDAASRKAASSWPAPARAFIGTLIEHPASARLSAQCAALHLEPRVQQAIFVRMTLLSGHTDRPVTDAPIWQLTLKKNKSGYTLTIWQADDLCMPTALNVTFTDIDFRSMSIDYADQASVRAAEPALLDLIRTAYAQLQAKAHSEPDSLAAGEKALLPLDAVLHLLDTVQASYDYDQRQAAMLDGLLDDDSQPVFSACAQSRGNTAAQRLRLWLRQPAAGRFWQRIWSALRTASGGYKPAVTALVSPEQLTRLQSDLDARMASHGFKGTFPDYRCGSRQPHGSFIGAAHCVWGLTEGGIQPRAFVSVLPDDEEIDPLTLDGYQALTSDDGLAQCRYFTESAFAASDIGGIISTAVLDALANDIASVVFIPKPTGLRQAVFGWMGVDPDAPLSVDTMLTCLTMAASAALLTIILAGVFVPLCSSIMHRSLFRGMYLIKMMPYKTIFLWALIIYAIALAMLLKKR